MLEIPAPGRMKTCFFIIQTYRNLGLTLLDDDVVPKVLCRARDQTQVESKNLTRLVAGSKEGFDNELQGGS